MTGEPMFPGTKRLAASLAVSLRSLLLPPHATPRERKAFREHLVSSVWAGLSNGILLLTDVILAKTLNATGGQITLLATLGPAANLASFYWAGQVRGRRKASFFFLAVLVGRVPMVLLLFWRSAAAMILVFFLYSVASALMITAANTLYQVSYPEETRSLRFGLATSLNALCSMASAYGAGLLLERHEGLYPWLFVFAGATGLLAAFHLYRMEAGPTGPTDPGSWLRDGAESVRRRLMPAAGGIRRWGLVEGISLARHVLRENPEFVRFERNFMIYGFAFLSVLPILPLYVVRELSMNYQQLAATKGLWALIGQVVLSPILGIGLGRLQALRFTGRAFLSLALYPFCLLVSTWPGLQARVAFVYLALLLYSIAMAGVGLSWNLGSMHFAGKEDASAFQGIHVALTGVRGLVAPSLGFAVYSLVGTRAVFGLSTALFLLAGILMLRQDRLSRRPRVPEVSVPRAPSI